jgi:hypothetical protein
MKHRSWFLRLVLAAGLVFGATERVAHAQQTTIAMHKCSVYACSNATQLKAEARLAFYSLPLGSIGFVSSAHYPLSAFVRMCAGARGAKEACLITAGDLGAVELDNRVYARAAAIAPIDIPVEVARSAGGADWEIVEGWIFHPNRLVATGRVGIAPLHNLFDPSNWIWMEFYDDRTKQVSKVFTGDLIVVRFVDGSTAQLKMFGPGAPSGHYFHWEPNSERDVNGNPIAYIPPPLPATPSGPGFALTPPWTDASFGSYLPDGVCAFLLSHCEFVASGSAQLDCYYRRLAFPCA